jgi:hypothetical protein
LRKVLIPVAAVLVVLAAAVAATAAIPDANGVIHGCRNLKSGVLRVIDTDKGQTCSKDEAALTWNQTGPQGPAGPPGISGYEVVSQTITAETQGVPVVAQCPPGKRVLGGGGGSGEAANGNNTNYDMVLTESRPMYPPDVDGWYVKLQAVNGAQGPFRVTAFAVCATIN